MIAKQTLRKLFLCLIILWAYTSHAQLSKTHYIPPLTFADAGSSTPEDQYIYLSTPKNSNVPYTIKPVGQPQTSYITGTVSNANPVEILIGDSGDTQLFIPSPSTSVVLNNKGYIIESEDVIYVSIRMNAGAQAGALVSKGISAPDTSFRIGSYTNTNPQDNYLNFVSVMATQDNTSVSFSNLPRGLIIQNYNGPTPVNITLNKGESYVLAINSNDTTVNTDGLIGCLVSSSKPVVVNCGSANGSFGNGGARDYGIDQIVGASKIGTEYIFVRGDGADDWENVLIVAHSNNTSININGNATGITINAGDYFVIEGDRYSRNNNMYVETSRPVFAYQGVGGIGNRGGPSEANQGMFFVPPLSCETRGNLDNIANINNIGTSIYEGGITIVTRAFANVSVTSSISGNVNLGAAQNVFGKADYVTYKIQGINGNITVESDDELYCAYFNYSGSATSGSFYSGFPSPPEINFETEFSTLGNCIPNVTLGAANAQAFDSFRWQFNDGSGFQDIPGETQFNFTPTIPSTYRLIGIIACTGEEFPSGGIPVSLCPDDRDNDGIIDNLDLDNDNDGILNCTESRGNVVLDLSNTRPPRLKFQDGTVNNNLATNTIVINPANLNASSVRLTGSGNIISEIPQVGNAENLYTISFTENVNIQLSEVSTRPHRNVDGEVFIVKTAPLNKNITLVDPDNRLLVDSNFDGIFETGVTTMSGSEIRFKFNPNPSGTTPYNFFANQVNGFSLTHSVENTMSTSSYSGNISLTCFKQDNDGDGIKDEFDLDSDNDGIPDFIENTGKFSPLSRIDSNNDGVDDIYQINSIPLDTDGDTVADVYDLDSDNDGITDLIETGALGLLSDTDLNGIVDGITFGINGWIDVAETSPDSNVIGYNLNDFDTDGIFSYIDDDSDGDSCTDVIEAGFSDGNMDTFLGDTNVVVDILADANTGQGLVTNANNGYTVPDANYLTASPISISQQPENIVACEASIESFIVNSPEAELFQWEISVDNGATWANLTNNAVYSGTQTNTLVISNIATTFNNQLYRVTLNRNGNSCGLISDIARLEVNALPIANTPSVYEQCDDDSNDGQSFFNLTLDIIKAEINSNFIADQLVFTYFETEVDAINNTNVIIAPEAYQDNLGFTPETIWVRVTDTNGCFRVVPLELVVNPSSAVLTSYNPQPLFECDDGSNNRDGISTFDLSEIRTEIETIIFNTVTVTVQFYQQLEDAELENNEITDISNHQNTNFPNVQTIWARVKSNLGNDCLGLKEFTNLLNVEALPVAHPVLFERACDSDVTDTVLSFPFNTSQLEADVLNGQNPADITITYLTENGNPLLYPDGSQVISPIQTSFLSQNQNIRIRVTNNNTQDPDGACFDETLVNFSVDAQPIIANSISPQIECDGNNGDINNDGIYPFNTTTFRETILGNQTGMELEFTYVDADGNLVTNPILPNPFITANQTITINVFNTNNPACSTSTTLDFVVNTLPEFEIESPRIVCSSDPTFNISLEPFEINNIENFAYEWRFEGNIISNNLILDNVTLPGTYFITLTKLDGTQCARTKSISVEASETANITIEDITIIDFSDNNSVTIDTSNIGRGIYEFALVENGENFIDFQSEPSFFNVRAGFYTLFIKEDICGIIELPVSVIGSRSFFTPNNDGINDYWQIQGIGSNLQPNSTIQIFDRYGKLLKQISPTSRGWDGTFNGQLMPTDDYWFKVILEDGRAILGHFSLKR